MTWLNSHTGKKIYPLELTPDMVTLEDVAHGLAGTMRYRAQLIGADLEISSEPRGGTVIRCTVDVDAPISAVN